MLTSFQRFVASSLCTASLAATPACAGGSETPPASTALADPETEGDVGSSTTSDLASTTGMVDMTGGEADTNADTNADTDRPGGTDPQETDAGTGGDTDTDAAGETGETGEVPAQAPQDGDNPAEPAVYLQFRVTSPAPLSFDEPVFNEEPIDTKGGQYNELLSVPGDDMDVVDFRIVPGQVDPQLRLQLECDAPDPSRVRVHLYDDDDGVLLDTIGCGEGEVSVLLTDASSADDYQLQVEITDGDPLLVAYSLSIDGFCFQGCEFGPYAG